MALHSGHMAYACSFRREGRVVLAYCGDGATSEGEFHEALNVAGVMSRHLPHRIE